VRYVVVRSPVIWRWTLREPKTTTIAMNILKDYDLGWLDEVCALVFNPEASRIDNFVILCL
jgi:hypothetical protein